MYGRHLRNGFNRSKNLSRSHTGKLTNRRLSTGECITKEKIAVIPTAITEGLWKGVTMAGTKPKNITREYLKESLEKLSNNGGKKVWIMSILRK